MNGFTWGASASQYPSMAEELGLVPQEMLNTDEQMAIVNAQAAPQEQNFLQQLGSAMGSESFQDIMGGLQMIGAAGTGDLAQMQQAQTSYDQRMAARRAQAAQEMQRKQTLDDRASQRQWQERQTLLSNLYKQYTPESVAQFQESGDYGSLVELPKAPGEQGRWQVIPGTNKRMNTLSGKVEDIPGMEAPKSKEQVAIEKEQRVQEKELKTQAKKIYTSAQDTLDALDRITDADITNVGGFITFGALPAGKASEAKFNQVLSQQFMNNISQMKGMGSLSNAEGSKITGAATALVDPETNAIRPGLDEDFVREQVQILKDGAKNMQAIADFYNKEGREPTLEELKEIRGTKETPSKKSRALPAMGDVVNGYRFLGGDPKQQGSWEKV